MQQAMKGVMPTSFHNPVIGNKYGKTVAMLLADREIVSPKEWEHDP